MLYLNENYCHQAMKDHDIIQKFCGNMRYEKREVPVSPPANEDTAATDNRIDIVGAN